MGKGAAVLRLSRSIDPEPFKTVLDGKVPDELHLARLDRDGNIHHRPSRDVTLPTPNSVLLDSTVTLPLEKVPKVS